MGWEFRDKRSFELSETPNICGQVTKIKARASNESSTAQGSFRNKGNVIRGKNEFLLLR